MGSKLLKCLYNTLQDRTNFLLKVFTETGLWNPHLKAERISAVLTIIFKSIRNAHKQQQLKKEKKVRSYWGWDG